MPSGVNNEIPLFTKEGAIVSIIYHSDAFHFSHSYTKKVNMPSGVNLLKKIPLFSKEGLGEICLIQGRFVEFHDLDC